MGACLSKKGTKGRDGEEPDKLPYTKAEKTDKGNKVADAETAPTPVNVTEEKAEKAGVLEQGPLDNCPQDDAVDEKLDIKESPEAKPKEQASPDMTGLQTTTVIEQVGNKDNQGCTLVVKETDVKLELKSDDNKTTSKHEEHSITKVKYDTRGTKVTPSVSVLREVHPVSVPIDNRPSSVDRISAGPNAAPMALFGALQYLKEQEQAQQVDSNEGSKPENTNTRPISDVFSNIYKTTDGPMMSAPTTEIKSFTESPTASSVPTTTASSRPVSDLFANIYSNPAQTRTVTSEVTAKGDMAVHRVQHVSVSHDAFRKSPPISATPPASASTPASTSPPPPATISPPSSPSPPSTTTSSNKFLSQIQEVPIKENGVTSENHIVNGMNGVDGVDDVMKRIETLTSDIAKVERQISEGTKMENTTVLTVDDDTDDGSSAPPSPLTPLRITEPGDEQTPLPGHVNANVIIAEHEEPIRVPQITIEVISPGGTDSPLSEATPEDEETHFTSEDEGDNDEDDENGLSFEEEPIVRKNLWSMVSEVFSTFKPENDLTLSRHTLCSTTRQRIIAALEKWMSTDCKLDGGDRHVNMVLGPAGIGKTCLMAEICKRHPDTIAGYHFFEYNSRNINHNRLHAVIISLAHNFCNVFPNYVNMLPTIDKLKQAVDYGSIPELFDMLVHIPLSSPDLEHDPEKQMLIVLDAIDECDLRDRDILLDILSNISEKCPSWLHILITSRTDARLLQGNDAVHVMEMKYKSNDNNVDMKRFFKEPLGRFMDRISLDGGLTQLAKKTEGSFLCAMLLKKRLNSLPPDRKIALREIVPMFPTSLSGVCKDIFDNFLESLSAVVHDGNEHRAYSTILSNLAVAREPLPVEFVLHVTNTKSKNPLPILGEIDHVLVIENGCVSFCHREIADWLLDDQMSATCSVDLVQGREQIATLCLKWLDTIMNDDQYEIQHNPLMDYALKHAVYHLLDVSKQQESLSTLLCSLLYIQAKLGVPNMQVSHIRDDYQHQHIQINKSGAHKLVSLTEYMKRYQKMLDQMNSYKKFLDEKFYDIQMCPDHVLQVAANYSTVDRIKQNARRELDDKEWIEDVTAIPETHCIALKLNGVIKAIDVSHDGKTIAAISKDDDYNLKLHLINTLTGEEKFKPIDIKTLNSRIGVVTKFFPDANNIFVGSLTTLISKTGKQTPSGFDVSGINVKDKFSIECADLSMKHFACGLTTFPWGGKSLHLAIFDMRTKKCLKTFEVLRFSHGGSAQFSIRACAVAKDKSYVCACVKMSAKPQLRLTIWNVSKFQVMNSIDVSNEEITKCLFVGEQLVLLGGGLRSSQGGKGSAQHVPVVSEFWNYKEVSNKISQQWDENETCSLFSRHEDTTACCRWYSNMESALIHIWKKSDVENVASSICRIRGVHEPSEMLSGGNCFVFLSHDEVYIYNMDDLEMLSQNQDAASHVMLPELVVHSVSFIPRSESIIIVSQDAKLNTSDETTYTVFISALEQDEMSLMQTPLKSIPRTNLKTIDIKGQFKTFCGAGASTEMCFPSCDGNVLVFNADDHIKIWDRVNDHITILQSYNDLQNKHPEFEEFTAVKAFTSPKDNLLAAIYGQLPFNIYIYDVRQGNQLRILSQDTRSACAVTDLIFLPSSGMLMAYHRSMKNTLVTWNPKTAQKIVSSSAVISYARASPASDRLAISSRHRNEGCIILRNSDNTMSKKMTMSSQWLPSNSESDLEFSPDGTILVGVCFATSVCRIWNAAKGDTLQDHPLAFNMQTDVVGMLTNTHVIFQDDKLTIVEVASGRVVAVLPLADIMERKAKMKGMLVSPKGAMVVGIRNSANLKIFKCHNFDMIKRKTTLQRMISFQKD